MPRDAANGAGWSARRLQGYSGAMSHPERIVPDATSPGIVALHLKRYQFAAPWCRDAEVLDAGCGVGYGSAFLGEVARRVVGVDRDANAIAYARERYARPNVEFLVGDVLQLAFADASFDAVCSFETIEHVDDVDAMLGETARVLRPGGVFVASTPRADKTTASPANPFHRMELAPADFEALLRRSFRDVELYGQRRLQTARHRLPAGGGGVGGGEGGPVPPAGVRPLAGG